MTYSNLMRLANGYAESKTLLIAAELGVFTALGERARRVGELARACRTAEQGMRLLLNALVGLRLLTVRNDLYRNSRFAQKYLDEQQEKLVERFEVKGVPTIIFLDRDGSERRDLRLVDHLGPDEFLERMLQLRNQ